MFSLKIETKNAAFQDKAEEIIRILESAISKIKDGDQEGTLRDTNGNLVGNFKGA
jgi:hypothetical protein